MHSPLTSTFLPVSSPRQPLSIMENPATVFLNRKRLLPFSIVIVYLVCTFLAETKSLTKWGHIVQISSVDYSVPESISNQRSIGLQSTTPPKNNINNETRQGLSSNGLAITNNGTQSAMSNGTSFSNNRTRQGKSSNGTTTMMSNGMQEASTNEATLSNNGARGIAACLLVLQDSLFLREWMAYHYVAMPLTSVVVGMDIKNPPESIQRIDEILDRYEGKMNITRWKNDSFILDDDMRNAIHRYEDFISKHPEQGKVNKGNNWGHLRDRLDARFGLNMSGSLRGSKPPQRRRQKEFASHCLWHHFQAGAEWVLLTDTDEFVLFNRYQQGQENRTAENIILGKDKNNARRQEYVDRQRDFVLPLRRDVISKLQANGTTIYHFLRHVYPKYRYEQPARELSHCFHMPGIRFYGDNAEFYKESAGSNGSGTATDSSFNESDVASHLFTLRQNLMTGRRNGRFSKAMVDVSKAGTNGFDRNWWAGAHENIHAPNRKLCKPYPGKRDYNPSTDYMSSLLRLHHYPGSLQAFMERTLDYRGRDPNLYFGNLHVGNGTVTADDDLLSWYDLFVEKVGPAEAARLVAEPKGLRTTN